MYFENNLRELRYLPTFRRDDGTLGGLRVSQRGALFAVASHFTLRTDPAIAVLPTGTGKTAVLMLTAFERQARRVLVVTPSRLVRNQIAEDFRQLITLKKLAVAPTDLPAPRIYEAEGRIVDEETWRTLEAYDVVVATPNAISPAIDGVSPPPSGFFDLVLVDEAHHSPAKSWEALLRHFSGIPRALFTATPFRRDRKEIPGRLVYTYPLRRAFEDGVFGRIEYVAVPERDTQAERDVAIAMEAERVLREDHAADLRHCLMVRTDQKTRANELKEIYGRNTQLRLEIIHSDHSLRHVKRSIQKLRDGSLDGIICVDMLGEGFDLPNLKVAAIHAPHRSLAVTLQFIGRFARTNAERIGSARFLAVPSEIVIERERLFDENAVWQEMITNLSQGRISEEERVRSALETFSPLGEGDEDSSEDTGPDLLDPHDLPLQALRPHKHVKVYRVRASGVDIATDLMFAGLKMVFHEVSAELSASVFILRERSRPKWTYLDRFARVEYDLFVVYYDEMDHLLFINSSCRAESLYDSIAQQYCNSSTVPERLPLHYLHRVFRGLSDLQVFNVGMRNRTASSRTESYRILAGSGADRALDPTDGHLYDQGHVYGRGECELENEDELDESENDGEVASRRRPVTLGYSSSGKVWSGERSLIPDFVMWCQTLARRIAEDGDVETGTGIDHLSVGEDAQAIPEHVLMARWDEVIYKSPPSVFYQERTSDGTLSGMHRECSLVDLELSVNRERSDAAQIHFEVTLPGVIRPWNGIFTLDSERQFSSEDIATAHDITIASHRERIDIATFLCSRPISFFFADFSRLQGRSYFPTRQSALRFLEPEQITALNWSIAGINIEREYATDPDGRLAADTIHGYLASVLGVAPSHPAEVVYYDHDPLEVADFVTLYRQSGVLHICLYHCKASGGRQPGQRIDDVLEVCGQVIKSVSWLRDLPWFNRHVEERPPSRLSVPRFIKGDAASLATILREAQSAGLSQRYEIVLVQPGIRKGHITAQMNHVLAAANGYVRRAGCEQLKIWASE